MAEEVVRAETEAIETSKVRLVASIRPVAHITFACFEYYSSVIMTTPILVDVIMDAICPGQTECTSVLLLMGAQQLALGLGTVVLGPILGSVSDDSGRKPVLMLILFSAIVPSVLLSCTRTNVVVYIWFGINLCDHSSQGRMPHTYCVRICGKRMSLMRGIVQQLWDSTASISAGYLVGSTLAAYFVKSLTQDLWIAVVLQISAAVYLKLFVVESNPRKFVLPAEQSLSEIKKPLLLVPELTKQSHSLTETARTIWASPKLRRIAFVDFLNSFASTGSSCFYMYYLRAAFGFVKDQYAEFWNIASVASVFGQLVVYPVLAHVLGERGVICAALLGSAGQVFAYAFAWTSWVPYAAAVMGVFPAFFQPAMGTMVSKGLDSDEQGKVQGFMSGARSAATNVGPLVLTPLAAMSFGDNPPFNLQGFPFVICGMAIVLGFLISLGVPLTATPKSTDYISVPFSR